MFCGLNWQPLRIVRISDIKSTSTQPIQVETDEGLALLKYIGNRQGTEALVGEIVAAELANRVGLTTPDFALMNIESFEIPANGIQTETGPCFASKWITEATTLSPSSKLVKKLRNKGDISRLVVFDTWIKNRDRFVKNHEQGASNFDNLLFVPDKRMVGMVVIDHTHAFVEATFEEEIEDSDWANEEIVYGLFPQFESLLNRKAVTNALETINFIDTDEIEEIVGRVPREWGLTSRTRKLFAANLRKRARLLSDWLPDRLFQQQEMFED